MKCALELSEQELDGRQVLIKSATDWETTGRPRGARGSDRKIQQQLQSDSPSLTGKTATQPGQQADNAKLFIGNLPFETERDDCLELLAPFGGVTELRLGQFEDSGKCKG